MTTLADSETELKAVTPLNDKMRDLRRQIIETCAKAGEGHIPSALSILDIVWVLYDKILAVDPQKPKSEHRDRFLLSKGHGCLALYVALADKGFFPREWLDRFCRPGAELLGHPDRNIPGVEIMSGSLGHGLPMAVGMAMALRVKKNPARVICLIGDQEAQEGTTWEAAALAAHCKLANLTCIIDHNGSSDTVVHMGSLARKFLAFDWDAHEVCGHNHHDLEKALRDCKAGAPTCIVAFTTKGAGCWVIEANPKAWHHRAPKAEELPQLLAAVA